LAHGISGGAIWLRARGPNTKLPGIRLVFAGIFTAVILMMGGQARCDFSDRDDVGQRAAAP